MKVKELIEELKKYDPEAVVCAGFDPIQAIEQLPSYWDGYVAEVKNNKWIYNTGKNKVVIHLWNEEEFLETYFFKKDENDNWIIPKLPYILKNIENIPKDMYDEYITKWSLIYIYLETIYKKINIEILKNKKMR